ncbi:MAG: exonuclease SbcCD subunit D C-terminal domain-containing protein [Alphaproteobacteria bacterium]|nr:exonuclease SbcCD subunit D C-terminal domain-containing protein [Alphaproteobacteria bacterium]
MKIFHTSDWHLGKQIGLFSRQDEYQSFLNWLLDEINKEKVDCLLISGDVFDTAITSNAVQRMYYKFLSKLSNTTCKNAVIISGNHDSVSFLKAPKEVLEAINVHVISQIEKENETVNFDQEIVELKNDKGDLEAVVCAVPFLREGDIKIDEFGTDEETKRKATSDGIKKHFVDVSKYAKKKYEAVPVIAMGHLYVDGVELNDNGRMLSIGNLEAVDVDEFKNNFDYVALGHIHKPQIVAKADNVRYSGSPLIIDFGEAEQQKIINLIETKGNDLDVLEVKVPKFASINQIVDDDIVKIEKKLLEISKENEKKDVFVSIEFTGNLAGVNLRQSLEDFLETNKLNIKICKIKINNNSTSVQEMIENSENLEDLKPVDVFKTILEDNNVPDDEKEKLLENFNIALEALNNKDND